MTGSYAYTPQIWPSLLTVLLLTALASFSWRRRAVPGARPFAAACLFALIWVAGAAAESMALEPATKVAWFKFQAAGDELLCELKAPSKVRLVAAYVIGLAASIGTGFIAASLVEVVMTSVLTLTGSAFLAMMIWVVGLVLAVYFGMHAFSAGFGYVLSDTCTRHINVAKRVPSRIASFFRRTPKEATA